MPKLLSNINSFIARTILFVLVFATGSPTLYAQHEADNWYFGAASMLHVNFAGNPTGTMVVPVLGNLGTAACMSDANGNTLFYSNGHVINNRLDQIMSGVSWADPLAGNHFVDPGGSRGMITVQAPGHDSLYYLFYMDVSVFENYTPRLRCARINMNGDNGLGVVEMKDSLMLNGDSVCIRLTAVKHCNKRDTWLVGHLSGSDKYFSFLITPNGINPVPVLSSANYLAGYYSKKGFMKSSPNGDKLASTYEDEANTNVLGNVELSDFNIQTGEVSNTKILQPKPSWAEPTGWTSGIGPAGVEFSASEKYLYVTGNYITSGFSGTHPWGHVFQFDISSNNQATIQASRYLVDSMDISLANGAQMAPNGKIYVADYSHDRLQCVNDPEGFQNACNYTRNALTIPGSPLMGNDLPFFLPNYLSHPVIVNGNCQAQNMSFSIQNLSAVSSLQWNFGDPASGLNNNSASLTPSHNYSTPGAYNVQLILQNANGCGADTLYKQVYAGNFSVSLGNDTTICAGDTLRLVMNVPFANNLWSDNSTDTIIKITQAGTYWINTTIGECSASDTIHILLANLPQFSLGNDTTICTNQSLILSPLPANINISYLWNTGSSTNALTVNNSGDYWLEETDNTGCKWRDSITVSFKTLPQFSLGNDTAICLHDTLSVNAFISGASSYLWNTSETTSLIQVEQPGIFWCDVTKDGCVYRDSIQLQVKSLPVVQLGNDTTLCEDQTLLLDIVNPLSTYQWQDGSTNSNYTVTGPGVYSAVVTMDGCIAKDTIHINYKHKPSFSLGEDQLICNGKHIVLSPAVDPLWQLLWQDGSSSINYTVTQPGIYTLNATNVCGSTTDEVIIKETVCDIYVPAVFTPNGDNLNDIFKVLGTELIADFDLKIYNRYGQKVFESKNTDLGWNGKWNGTDQSTGTYVWTLAYRKMNQNKTTQLKGFILLVR